MELKTETIKILIVEDYELIAKAFEELLNRQADITIIDQVGTREKALDLLRRRDDIDLVLMDLFLDRDEDHEEPEGLKACREIIGHINRTRTKKIKTILLTAHIDGKWIKKAFDLGVNGYITKDQGMDVLLKAIHNIMKNGAFFRCYEGIVEEAMLEYNERKKMIEEEEIKLTPSEKEILLYISKGIKGSKIAKIRGIKEGTVNIHKRNLFEKLGATNAPEAVAIAFEKGLLP